MENFYHSCQTFFDKKREINFACKALSIFFLTANFGSAKMFVILFDVNSSLISWMLFDLIAASSLMLERKHQFIHSTRTSLICEFVETKILCFCFIREIWYFSLRLSSHFTFPRISWYLVLCKLQRCDVMWSEALLWCVILRKMTTSSFCTN